MLRSFSTDSFVDVHSHGNKSNNENVIFSLIAGRDEVRDGLYSAGIHPWFIRDNHQLQLDQLRELLKGADCIALGEVGLDTLCTTSYDLQKRILMQQIEMAVEFSKPVVLHVVKAFNDIIPVIKNNPTIVSWIFHRFSGSSEIANQLIKYSCYFSFGHEVLSKSLKKKQLLQSIPLDRILIESDEWVGDVEEVYTAISEMLDVSIDTLKFLIAQNANRALFNLE